MNQPKSNALEKRLAQLYSRINYERQSRMTPRSFKLVYMRDLLGRLGNPHLNYPVVHVAGTKGKGSVTTMLGSILSSTGMKTGVYTSPHLETIHQRIAVNSRLISDAHLLDVLDKIHPVVTAMDREAKRDNRRHLTFFEITTAAMFCYFAHQRVEMAVIEVGLGGRLDSTNVCEPTLTIITNISLDHTKQLGGTLDAIASEKAGIIKTGIPVISGATDPAAADVISQVAQKQGSRLYEFKKDFFLDPDGEVANKNAPPLSLVRENRFSTTGKIGRQSYEIRDLKINLLGTHQKENASIVVAASKLMAAQFQIPDSDIRKGLSTATLNGRTEVLGDSPCVVIDIAHNVASVAALIDMLAFQLTNWKSARSRRLITAISREKDAIGMIRLLIQHFDEVIFTKYQNNPRGKSPEQLFEIAARLRDQMNLATVLKIEPNPQTAWSGLCETAATDDIICITGSVYLVAELRQSVVDSQSDKLR